MTAIHESTVQQLRQRIAKMSDRGVSEATGLAEVHLLPGIACSAKSTEQ
jgi:hypothetical protein